MSEKRPATAIPCEALYWALLDPAPLGARAIRPEQRGYLFESELPVAIEELQCAYAPLPGGRVIACGIEKDRLAALAGTESASAVPAGLPEWLPEDARATIDARLLELLHGELEPRACRRARRRFALVAVASMAAAAAILLSGAYGRVKALDHAASIADSRRDELVRAALAGTSRRGGLPDDLRLQAELRELRGTRSAGAPVVEDAGPVLAASLASWPDGVGAQVDGMSVSCSKITMRGQALTSEEMQQIVDGIEAIPGWRTAPPTYRVAKDGVAFTIEAAAESQQTGGTP